MKCLGAFYQNVGTIVSALCETPEQQLRKALRQERLRSEKLWKALKHKETEAETPSRCENAYVSDGRPPPQLDSNAASSESVRLEAQWSLRPSVGTWLMTVQPRALDPSMEGNLREVVHAHCKSHETNAVQMSLQQQLQESQEQLELAVANQDLLQKTVSQLVEDVQRKEQKICALEDQQDKDIRRVIRAKDCELADRDAQHREDAQMIIKAKDLEVLDLSRSLEESKAREEALASELQRTKEQLLIFQKTEEASKKFKEARDDAKDETIQDLLKEAQAYRDREVMLKKMLQEKENILREIDEASRKEKDKEIIDLLREMQALKEREAALKETYQKQEELLQERDEARKKLQETEVSLWSLKNQVQTKDVENNILRKQGVQQEHYHNGSKQGSEPASPSGSQKTHTPTCAGSPGLKTLEVPPDSPLMSPSDLERVLRKQERSLCEKEEQVAILVNRQEKELRLAYAEVQTLRRELQIAMTQKNSLVEEAKAKASELQAAQRRHLLEMKLKDQKLARFQHPSQHCQDVNPDME